MPAKYREMHDFHEYYSGARKAPYLTIFVGGNHEAANYLFELYYGGWVAPNIYYMGAANVLKLGPLRIAGMSGIWKGFDYKKQHFERLPYNEGDVKSIYHVRELEVRKLLQVRTQVDVGISHDWPRGVEWKGDWKKLFRQKAHLEEDARNGQLGSVAATYVMDRLRPPYWFSAHLHCKYAAVVDHEKSGEASGPMASASSNGAAVEEMPKKNSIWRMTSRPLRFNRRRTRMRLTLTWTTTSRNQHQKLAKPAQLYLSTQTRSISSSKMTLIHQPLP